MNLIDYEDNDLRPFMIRPVREGGTHAFFFVDQSSGAGCEIKDGAKILYAGDTYKFSCNENAGSWQIALRPNAQVEDSTGRENLAAPSEYVKK